MEALVDGGAGPARPTAGPTDDGDGDQGFPLVVAPLAALRCTIVLA